MKVSKIELPETYDKDKILMALTKLIGQLEYFSIDGVKCAKEQLLLQMNIQQERIIGLEKQIKEIKEMQEKNEKPEKEVPKPPKEEYPSFAQRIPLTKKNA